MKLSTPTTLSCLVFAFSCGTSNTTTSELSDFDNPAPRRIEECGIDTYERSPRPDCGVESYISIRSEHCPVELHNARASMQCPGSVAGHEYTTYGACRPGDTNLGVEWSDEVRRPPKHCRTPDQPATCRKPEFGVELFSSCQHPVHGVASYNTCPDASRPIYFSCTALSRGELEQYLISVESQIGSVGPMMILHQSNLFKTTFSEAALACLIQKHESDPLSVEVIRDLKTQFPIFMGKEYAAELAVNCEKAFSEATQTQNCEQTPDTTACRAQKALASTESWLRGHAERTAKFQSEPAVAMRPDLGERLKKLNTDIQEFLK